MISGIQAALTALKAYSAKLQNNGNNIANMDTDGFKKGRVLLSEAKPQGVAAKFDKVNTSGPVIYETTVEGMKPVEQSNVDISEEIPDLMMNTHIFKANLKMFQTEDEMVESLLDLKA